jgi:hypothetical protein
MKRSMKQNTMKFVVLMTLALALMGAGSKAATISNGIFNSFFRTSAYSAPANTYTGLLSTCPTTGNTGTELSGNGYTRSAAIAKADASWTYTAATFIGASTISNAATITFPAVTTSSWTINCFGQYDAASAGNLLYWGPISGAPVAVSVTGVASFAPATLVFTEN